MAIADSCVTAFAATWSARALAEPLHVAPEGDRDYLARVPITLLPMDAELRETLVALGLRTAGAFARPKGVAVDSEGHVYVADAAFNNIQIFDDQGRLLLFFSGGGHGEGQLYVPLGLGIDHRDRIYVADRANNRIQVFQYVSLEDGGGAVANADRGEGR